MEKNEIATSIILCVHDAEKTIKATLDSIFASSLERFEVVLVDDASTDGTVDICRDYPVRIVALEQNKGPAVGRNRGVREAKGRIIIFLDADVIFGPEVLPRMVSLLDQEPELAGVGTISSPEPLNPTFYSRYFALQEYNMLLNEFKNRDQVRRPYIYTRCGALRKTVFEQLGGFNESYTKPSIEDYELSMRMKGRFFVLYDRTLENNHYFPDTFQKIFGRYYRNARELYRMMHTTQVRDLGPYDNDIQARLLLSLSAVILFLGVINLSFIPISGALFGLAAFQRRKFLGLLYQRAGFGFMVKSWLFYALSTFPLALGMVSGYVSVLKKRLAYHSR